MVLVDGGGGGYPTSLPSVGDNLEVNRDVLRDVAKKLQADLDELNGWGSGSLKDLQNNDAGRVDADALGDYPAGQQISGTFENAYSQIGGTYSEFVSSYQQVIDAINRTVNSYQRAEDATETAAKQVPTGSDGGGGGAW